MVANANPIFTSLSQRMNAASTWCIPIPIILQLAVKTVCLLLKMILFGCIINYSGLSNWLYTFGVCILTSLPFILFLLEVTFDIYGHGSKLGTCKENKLADSFSKELNQCVIGRSYSCGAYVDPASIGYCEYHNFDNFEQCGTNGLFGSSFCKKDTSGVPRCFANQYCYDTSQGCSVNSDCPSGYMCNLNNCGTVCTALCPIDLTGSVVYTPGVCWDTYYQPSLGVYQEPVVIDKECTVGQPVDASGKLTCDADTAHVVAKA